MRMAYCSDYLEMLIQFGFLTMFAASMPLAPLFALVNNIFEIRIDAHKLIRYTRRLVQARKCRARFFRPALFKHECFKKFNNSVCRRGIPMRKPSIEPWFGLLRLFTKIACFTNAWTIAFTMSIIDKFVSIH